MFNIHIMDDDKNVGKYCVMAGENKVADDCSREEGEYLVKWLKIAYKQGVSDASGLNLKSISD